MQIRKILATPRSFAKEDDAPLRLLENAGFTVVRNVSGGILPKAEMIRQLSECEGVIVGVDPMDAEVIGSAKKLRAIAKYGVGTDNIDLDATKRRGIPVSVTTGANADAVADFTFALMLAAARRVVPIDRACRNRDWGKRTSLDVYGRTLGILGLGAVGRGVAKRAACGFGMTVLAYDPYWDESFASAYGIQQAQPEEIYHTCDFISLHLPLNERTKGMIGRM